MRASVIASDHSEPAANLIGAREQLRGSDIVRDAAPHKSGSPPTQNHTKILKNSVTENIQEKIKISACDEDLNADPDPDNNN